MSVALAVAGASSFCAYLSFNLLAAALPLYLSREFGFGLSAVGAVVGLGYLLNFLAYAAVGSVASGRGLTRCAIAGALAMAVAVPVYGLLHGPLPLALTSLWRGLAMSAFVVAVGAIVGRAADPRRRGAQVGAYGLFSNAAIAAGPPAGLILLEGFGPDVLFLASAVVAVLGAVLAALLPPGNEPGPGQGGTPWPGRFAVARALLAPAGVVAVAGVCYGTVLAFMPGYLSSRGISNPGLFFTAELPALLLLRVAAGTLSDACGRPAVAGAGLVLVGASVLGLNAVSGVFSTLLAGLVYGAGWALLVPAAMAWLFDRVPEGGQGLASATNYGALDAGRAAGALGLGYVAGSSLAPSPFVVGGLLATVIGVALLASAVLLERRGMVGRAGQRPLVNDAMPRG